MFDLKGHHRGATRAVDLRFPISDLRSTPPDRVNRISYIVNLGVSVANRWQMALPLPTKSRLRKPLPTFRQKKSPALIKPKNLKLLGKYAKSGSATGLQNTHIL